MKPKSRTFNLSAFAAIAITCTAGTAADMYYKSTTAANAWTGAFWGNASGGPYDQSWVSGSTAIFDDNGGTALAITGASTDVAGITANESVTVTASGTLGTGGTVATITVAGGKTLNFQGQALSIAAGTGFIKTGAGTLSLTGSTYPGGFTLNEGTVAAGGVNALGSGGPLVIAGGTTIRSTATNARSFAGKLTAMTINGDFTLGDATNNGALTFDAATELGSATRTLTVASAVNFNGSITADPGVGITKLGAGTLTLGGVNSYDGPTTVSAGVLFFQKRLSLYNGDDSMWNGAHIVVNGTGSLGFGMGGTGEFTSAEVASLSALTPALGITTAGGSATLSDVVTGGAFTKLGGNTLTLTAANTYSGGTTIAGGTLAVSSIGNNTATPSNLGTTGGITFSAATTLLYTGTGETTDRVVNFSSANGGTVTTNGTGTLTFSSPFTGAAAAMGIQIAGAGNGAMNGMANTTALLNFNKDGAGKWTVNGALTMNGGNIRPRGGVLAFSSTASTADNAILTLGNRSNVGIVSFSAGSSVKTASTNTNGIIGAWATYNDTDWAKTNGTGTAIDGYTAYANDTWAAGTNTNVTLAGADPASGSTTNTLRFNESGAKTLTLAGSNTLVAGGVLVTPAVGSNTTTINGGTLVIGNPTNTALGDLVLQQHNTSGDLVIGSVIANTPAPAARTGSFTSGQKVITGLSSTADLVVGMTVTGTGIAGSSTIASINSASQITLNNNTTAAGTAVSLTFGASNILTKAGTGTVTLNGANTYTGRTWVLEGTLVANAKSGDAPFEIAQNGTLKIGYTTGGGYAGTGMVIHGAGTAATTGFYLEGGDSYNCQGQVQLQDAPTTIRQYGTGYAGIGTFDVNGDGMVVNAAASGSMTDTNVKFVSRGYGMSINIAAGANTATGDFVLNGPLDVDHTGNGFYKRGAGSLRLNAAATANNRHVRIVGGSIICGIDGALGTSSRIYVPTNTKLILNGYNQTTSSLMTNGGNIVGGASGVGILTLNQADDATFSGIIGGTGTNENNVGITIAGTGKVLTLSGSNTYVGATTVNAGTLRVTNGSGSATGTGTVTVNSAGTLDGNGIVGDVVVSSGGGTLTAGNAGSGDLSVNNLAFDGIGTVNVIPGTTSIAVANTLTASGAADSVTVNIGTVPVAAGTYPLITHTGAIGGTGLAAFKLGTNPGGPFTYTLVDSAGALSLQVATSAIFWSGGVDSDWSTTKQNWAVSGVPVFYANGNDVVFNDDATLYSVDISAADVSPGSVTFSNSLNDYTVGGSKGIAGSTGVLKSGSGFVTLNTTNSFTGAVTVNQGTLEVLSIANNGTNSSLGSGTDVFLSGGTLTYLGAAPATTDRTFTVSSNSSIDLVNSDLTLTGFVDGTGGLTKKGAGTLVLDNAGNNISGPIVVNGGTLQVDAVAKLGAGSLTLGGGTLKLTGTDAMTVGKVIALTTGGGTIQVDNTGGATFSATAPCITGTGGLTKTGTGTMTVTTNGNFSGGVTVNGGTLRINAGGWYTNPFGQTNALTINAGGKVETGGTHSLGVDQNTIHINGGILQLAAENYISNLQMTGGSLTGGQLRTWGGTMTFNASATGSLIESPTFQLVGAATLSVADGDAADDLTVSSGIFGSVALTKSGDGKLVLSGQNIHTGNTVANAGTLELAKDAKLTFALGATSGTTNKLTGSGTVVVNGNFAIDTTAAAALTAGTWVIEDVAGLTGAYGADFKVTDPNGTVWANSGDVWTKSAGSQQWSFDETTGTLTLTQSGYDSWASQIPNAADRDRGDDPDSDGFTNLQEYLFGTSPVAANGSLATSERSGGTLTIRWKQRTSGTSYQLKESATLNADWANASATPTTDGAPSGDYQPMKADIAIGAGKLFFRVEGTEN